MTHFLRATVLAICALCLAVPPATAADPAFTPAQRAEIVGIVRDAMKSDPSILRDAIRALQADEDARANAEARAAIGLHRKALLENAADAVAGNPHGDVTVVEFYDPRCPYCRKMLPGIEALLQKDHSIRLVLKEIPVLGPSSVLESQAILAAQNQGGYFKMQQKLMSDPTQPDDAFIRDTARALGLDANKLAADMKSDPLIKRLEANMDLSHALHITGTPTFVVGEQIIPGMVDAVQLEQAVVEARKHA